MNMSIGFTRIFFMATSLLLMVIYSGDWVLGVALGIGLSAMLMGFDFLFRRYDLRMFNLMVVGLFFGYLMGQALVAALSVLLIVPEVAKAALVLFSLYLGTVMTLRAADNFYLVIPFVRLSPNDRQKKDLVVEGSALMDARLIDLCNSGLLDRSLIIPRFLVQELQARGIESKKTLDILKKLETIPELELRYNDTDFSDVKNPAVKMVRLARLLNANLLIADASRAQTSHVEGVKMVNLQFLSNTLKPLMQAGEQIKIKIQRYGKEPMQGVGYLEDGTMVVVNGGGQYLGETVGAWVLSVKHTASGRIVFCNAEEGDSGYPHESTSEE